MKSSISVLKAPKFWKWQNEGTNSRANLQKGGEWAFVHEDNCKISNDCSILHVKMMEELVNFL